jgi:cytochrome c-type biogenesis protein CcmH
MLRQGSDEAQIVEFMVQRYGDFVLYQPPLKASTVMLWFGPAAVLAVGLAAVAWRLRRSAQPSEADLSDDERLAAARLLGRGGGEAAQ